MRGNEPGGEDFAESVRALRAELALMMPRPAVVEARAAELRAWLGGAGEVSLTAEPWRAVLDLVASRTGEAPRAVALLFADHIDRAVDGWRAVEILAGARDREVVRRGLEGAAALAARGVALDDAALRSIAHAVTGSGPLATDDGLALAARVLAGSGGGSPRDALERTLLVARTHAARVLAATLLDASGEPASERIAQALLGDEAFAALLPLLRFTRATHADLLAIVPRAGEEPPALRDLLAAERELGAEGLRTVLAEIGWGRLNLGLRVRRVLGVSLDGSFPLALSPAEAALFARAGEAQVVFDRTLVVAHGGSVAHEDASLAPSGEDPLARFRAYNLAHAEALAEILDVAPLDAARSRRLIALLDRLCADYAVLFADHDAEARDLPALWAALRAEITTRLEAERERTLLSSETTRLVILFEDPPSLAAVTTLHGLKRYLHQRGLKLAFSLFESGRTTNRTVDLLVLQHGRIWRAAQPVRYVDVDERDGGTTGHALLPYPVRVVADGFSRQLVSGRESLPSCDVFCYGNEVHYYVRFRNHPAFVRIDYAPPVYGGMVDLQYYGVSQYELEHHPNLDLDAIRTFLRQLDFDVQIEQLRVHARYDKERARSLDDLCAKIEALFRLVPSMMELDWIIGSLRYSPQAKTIVASAWAECFERWGVLPVDQLLTAKGTEVLLGRVPGPQGEQEIAWPGRGEYQDRYSERPADAVIERAIEALRADGISFELPAHEAGAALGQVGVERVLLRPLHAAVRRGEIVASAEGFAPQSAALFRRIHEAEVFAEMVLAAGMEMKRAARLAAAVAPLERTLRFTTTGAVNGFITEKARLVLRGHSLGIYVLRDPNGLARLAVYGFAEGLSRRREREDGPWHGSWSADLEPFLELLRRNAYLGAGEAWRTLAEAADPRAVASAVLATPAEAALSGAREERFLPGLRASPGRAVGRAALGLAGRSAQDVLGAILVVPAMRPEDNAYLYRARGIVSTGGGVLSHAGLLANQFGKPALVVDGSWQDSLGTLALRYEALEYEEERREIGGLSVVARTRIRHREDVLRDGDLLVLDADEGVLRILGQSPDALALHDHLLQLAVCDRALADSADASTVLALRGRRLRACHLLEKVLRRLEAPELARHAVRELLTGAVDAFGTASGAAADDDRVRLLRLLLDNPAVGGAARDRLRTSIMRLRETFRARSEEARRFLARAHHVTEILALRVEALRARAVLDAAEDLGARVGLVAGSATAPVAAIVDRAAADSLARVRSRDVAELRALGGDAAGAGAASRARHVLRALSRLDEVLPADAADRAEIARVADALSRTDRARLGALGGRFVIEPRDGGLEMQPLIGWKAANLAEVGVLAVDSGVPPWFVVTNRAFGAAMDTVVETKGDGRRPLRDAIERILVRSDLDDARRSFEIRELWEAVVLPDAVVSAVLDAYRVLSRGAPDDAAFVAVRSSGLEEDSESRSRAGEFDTFLFVRGEASLLAHVRRAWSGLWTERAIHNRAAFGLDPVDTGGGVLVQRMVRARVSGVAQTINPAGGRHREMVINVGYGLGEGIVSGLVAADQIVVLKDEENDDRERPLALRYATADKLQQVVFDEAAGQGTRLVEVPYHQRLRAALEYVEIQELVQVALALERGYGYPLNIEFAIEDTSLHVLQARPVAGAANVFAETRERFPLPPGGDR